MAPHWYWVRAFSRRETDVSWRFTEPTTKLGQGRPAPLRASTLDT